MLNFMNRLLQKDYSRYNPNAAANDGNWQHLCRPGLALLPLLTVVHIKPGRHLLI